MIVIADNFSLDNFTEELLLDVSKGIIIETSILTLDCPRAFIREYVETPLLASINKIYSAIKKPETAIIFSKALSLEIDYNDVELKFMELRELDEAFSKLQYEYKDLQNFKIKKGKIIFDECDVILVGKFIGSKPAEGSFELPIDGSIAWCAIEISVVRAPANS